MSLPDPALDALPPLHLRFDDEVAVLVVPADLAFEDLREWLRARLPERLESVQNRSLRLDLGEREIKLFDLRRLIHLLRDEFKADVTGLYVRPEAIHKYAERELKLRLFAVDPTTAPTEELVPDKFVEAPEAEIPSLKPEPEPQPEPEPAIEAPSEPVVTEAIVTEQAPIAPKLDPSGGGRRSLTVHRTLRSGASVRFDGDVVLFGDVNPGAQIVASGNIVVMGALKGMAHAGATGDEEAFILGFELRPTQLRIGRRIAIPPERGPEGKAHEAEMASVVDGQIVIEPYRKSR
jgi:septum site-determining protein MinC